MTISKGLHVWQPEISNHISVWLYQFDPAHEASGHRGAQREGHNCSYCVSVSNKRSLSPILGPASTSTTISRVISRYLTYICMTLQVWSPTKQVSTTELQRMTHNCKYCVSVKGKNELATDPRRSLKFQNHLSIDVYLRYPNPHLTQHGYTNTLPKTGTPPYRCFHRTRSDSSKQALAWKYVRRITTHKISKLGTPHGRVFTKSDRTILT